MAFRFPTQPPKTLMELFDRLRELLPQVEVKVLASREIGTTETPIAHGLRQVPIFVRTSNPHCLAVIRKTKNPDDKCVYLRATNKVVADVWVVAVGSIGRRQVENGGYHYPDWDPAGDATGDHKFSIDAADETASGFDYAETKIIAGTGATVTKTTGSHGKALAISATGDHLVKARNADATTVGGLEEKTASSDTITRERFTDPVDGIEKVRFNATPVQATGGSWLYTGSIQATNLHDPVKAFVKSKEGMGGLDPGQSELWAVLPGGTYEHKAVGQVYGLAPDGTETFALSLGQRVWLAPWLGASDSIDHGGFCTVTTLGNGSTKAVLTPTADVLAVGDMFKVEGVGAEFENWYWEVLDLPAMTLAYRPDYVSATTYNLLTSTEVSQSGSVTREATVTIPGGSSGGTPFSVSVFEMLAGVNVSAIPKGVVNWEVLAYLVADDPAATVFIRAHLSTNQGTDHNFGYADSSPIHATSATLLRFQGTISTDQACSPADKLSAVFSGFSNSASLVTIKLVYNSASHATRVQTPLETASYGTLDHQLLTATSRGFTDDQTALAASRRHPRCEIADVAVIPTSFSAGNLTPDPTSDTVIVPAGSSVERIDTSRWPEGVARLTLYFVSGGSIIQGATDSGNLLHFSLGNFGGSIPGSETVQLDFGTGGIADLLLIGGAWHVRSFNVGIWENPT
jgi:hypothetical protein